jgi:hypothetical protein
MAVVELLGSTGDGGGLLLGVSVSGDYLGRTKCWGRSWLPMVEPDASLAVACGGW